MGGPSVHGHCAQEEKSGDCNCWGMVQDLPDSSQCALHSIVVVFGVWWILFLESEILPLHLSYLSRKKFSVSVNLLLSVCFITLSWELVQSRLSKS